MLHNSQLLSHILPECANVEPDRMGAQPDNNISSSEGEEQPAAIDPINLQGQVMQAPDQTPAVSNLPCSLAASKLLASDIEEKEQARPSISPTPLECQHHQWRSDFRARCSERLMDRRHLSPDEYLQGCVPQLAAANQPMESQL
ncbi:UNVERIFIED_CONTAM: hypothetical protein K2H54_058425 [Gekko kuhli]